MTPSSPSSPQSLAPASVPFGGLKPAGITLETAQAVIWPVPYERTTSYVQGTVRAPTEILRASSQVEFWDEEVGFSLADARILTLPDSAFGTMGIDPAIGLIGQTAGEYARLDGFVVALGGEHAITSPIVAAYAARHPTLSVLQIDAHADLRDDYLGTRHNHACAMRRVLEHAPAVQVGIRSVSDEEAAAIPSLRTRIFYDHDMRDAPDWIDQVVDALTDPVYLTIDVDGLELGLVPAVGTPEPGGLAWRELLALLRAVFQRRRVVACDVVELCPIPGFVSPNLVCARLVYKLLTYKFALGRP